MTPRYEEILSDVTVETLERLAFIFASREDDFDALETDDAEVAEVNFMGPLTGVLVIGISKSALPELAANMLGEDDPDRITEEQKKDTLKETLNIICGNLLPEISDKQAIYDIKAPEIVPASFVHDVSSQYRHKISKNLSLDDGSCVMTLLLENETLPEPGLLE